MALTTPPAAPPGALSGVRVLDLSWLIPGPFCTTLLCEMGAEVIKIERPGGGDYMREGRPAEFEAINRGKRSVVLDLKQPQGREIFYRMVREADVLIESYSPGVATRLGIDYASVAAQNPRLVYLSLSGYGQDGPYAKRPGHDINFMAATGALSVPSRFGERPARGGLPTGDLAAGLYGVINIQSALMARERSGQGACIDLSIAEAVLHWSQIRLADRWRTPRQDDWWAHLDPGNEVYDTADGRQLAIALVEEKFLHAFRRASGCKGTELDAVFDEHNRCSPAGALRFRQMVASVVAARSCEQWEALLTEHRIPFTRVAQPDEVLQDKHFRERGMLEGVRDRQGNRTVHVRTPGLAAVAAHALAAAPARGENTEQVLQDFGIDAAAFAALKEQKIVE